jgi:hypothetical protein
MPAGKRSLQARQRFFDVARQRDGVGRRLLLDAQDDGRLAFIPGVAALVGRSESHLGDLAHQDRLARLGCQGQVLQIVQQRGSAQVADQVLTPVQLQETARGVAGVALQRRFQLLVRDAEFGHAHGVGLHLELPHLTADGDDLRHALHRQQAGSQHPVGVLAHGHRTDLRGVHGDRDLHDLAHDRADRAHAGQHAFGNAFLHRRESLADELAGTEDVGAPVEGDVDERQAGR